MVLNFGSANGPARTNSDSTSASWAEIGPRECGTQILSCAVRGRYENLDLIRSRPIERRRERLRIGVGDDVSVGVRPDHSGENDGGRDRVGAAKRQVRYGRRLAVDNVLSALPMAPVTFRVEPLHLDDEAREFNEHSVDCLWSAWGQIPCHGVGNDVREPAREIWLGTYADLTRRVDARLAECPALADELAEIMRRVAADQPPVVEATAGLSLGTDTKTSRDVLLANRNTKD